MQVILAHGIDPAVILPPVRPDLKPADIPRPPHLAAVHRIPSPHVQHKRQRRQVKLPLRPVQRPCNRLQRLENAVPGKGIGRQRIKFKVAQRPYLLEPQRKPRSRLGRDRCRMRHDIPGPVIAPHRNIPQNGNHVLQLHRPGLRRVVRLHAFHAPHGPVSGRHVVADPVPAHDLRRVRPHGHRGRAAPLGQGRPVAFARKPLFNRQALPQKQDHVPSSPQILSPARQAIAAS